MVWDVGPSSRKNIVFGICENRTFDQYLLNTMHWDSGTGTPPWHSEVDTWGLCLTYILTPRTFKSYRFLSQMIIESAPVPTRPGVDRVKNTKEWYCRAQVQVQVRWGSGWSESGKVQLQNSKLKDLDLSSTQFLVFTHHHPPSTTNFFLGF